MGQKFTVVYEATPNPNSMRFVVGMRISDETVQFDDPTKSSRSPIAQKLFGFPWAQAVMVGPDFITVTKQNWVDWSVIADPLASLIEEHLERDEGILLPAENFAVENEDGKAAEGRDGNAPQDGDSPDVLKIKMILQREIRPAVQMDGGDILFHKYEGNRLYLKLQGACSGCPSSMITLKDGIEVRMKEEIPTLLEVISV